MLKKELEIDWFFLTISNKRDIYTKKTKTTIYYTESLDLTKEYNKKIEERQEIVQYIKELTDEFLKQIEEKEDNEKFTMYFKEKELEEMLIIWKGKRIEFLKEFMLSIYSRSKKSLTLDITTNLNLEVYLNKEALKLNNWIYLLKS